MSTGSARWSYRAPLPTEDRCMEAQHLARLDDDGAVAHDGTGRVGGSAIVTSPEGPEVPVLAPVLPFSRSLSRRRQLGATPVRASGVCPGARRTVDSRSGADVVVSDAWPLPVEPDRVLLADAWPLPVDVDALLLQALPADDAADPTVPGLTPEEVVAAVAAGALSVASGGRSAGPVSAAPPAGARRGATAKHRRPSTRTRRPAGYLAAALIGAAGIAVITSGDQGHVARAAGADELVSVAEELGLVQARQPTISGDEAAERLQDMVASRAQREDEQAAAAQVQADADRVALQAVADAAAAAAEAARPKAVLPVQGARLSSGFGYRWGTLHAGIDFAAPLGTPEYAAMDGVVVRAGAASGFGLAVYIQHENGDVTVYGHMQEILVAEGQTVRAGDTIALLGNRGQSTGPHLHFEVHIGGLDGEKVDPLPWLRDRGVQV